MAQDTRIGTEVAGHRIEAPLGRGGMSVVYLAEDLRLGRKVALKLLSPQLAENREFRERFLRESRIAASIDHPNIVPVYEAGEEEGLLYISMRYVEGTDLGATITSEGPLDLARTVTILSQVAAALDTAHQRELVHRDVKPGNILLGRSTTGETGDHAYLADFGLTKRALSGSGFTATGQMVGTIDYVAPEQIRGEPVDGRADVYSLGCVVFECLTGHAPFPRDREVAVLWAHMQDPAPSIAKERGDVPPGVDHVVARAMAKDREDRYPTATELVDDLRTELEPAVAARRARRPFVPAAKRRRTRRVALGAAAVALAVAATVVYTATRPPPLVVPQANSLSRLDPEEGRFVETRSVNEQPVALAFGEGTVWTINQGRNTVQRVDPEDIEADPVTVGVQGVPTGLAVGEGSAWVTTGFTTGEIASTLYRLNPATDQLTPWTDVPSGSQAVVVGGRFVWVAATNQDRLLRFDPVTTDRVAVQLEVDSDPVALAVGQGDAEGIWTANNLGSSVSRVSFDGTLVGTYPVPGPPDAVAVGAGAVWVASQATDAVYRLDPADGVVLATIAVPDGPAALAVTGGSVWVCSSTAGVVARVDVATEVAERVRVEGAPISIVADPNGSLWVGVGPS